MKDEGYYHGSLKNYRRFVKKLSKKMLDKIRKLCYNKNEKFCCGAGWGSLPTPNFPRLFRAHMRPSCGGRHVGGLPSRRRAEFWGNRGPRKIFVKTLSYGTSSHVPLLYHIQTLLSRGFEKFFLGFVQNLEPRIKKVSPPASLVYHKTADLSIGKCRKNKKIFRANHLTEQGKCAIIKPSKGGNEV